MRSNAVLNIENIDNYCFLWSILVYLHRCMNSHPNRVSSYKQHSNEVNIEGFDFTNGFNCSNVLKFKELNNLSNNIFETNSYRAQIKRRHKLIRVDVSKNESHRFIDLLFTENTLLSLKI